MSVKNENQVENYEPLDLQLSRLLCDISGNSSTWLAELFAHLSYRTRNGDICLILVVEKSITIPEIDPELPMVRLSSENLTIVQTLNIVGSNRDSFKPVIIDGKRLYLKRYYNYEYDLLRIINEKTENLLPDIENSLFQETLQNLFPANTTDDYQKLSAALSSRRRFFVITGGPGTGKTTTVVKIIAALLSAQKNLRIQLTAPTGKAAARLQESITGAIDNLNIANDLKLLIPSKVMTIHRLIGARPGTLKTKYNKDRQLPLDLLIADEASMIDLPLLTKTMAALHSDARIILIGDHNQLASVESGAVLGDICRAVEFSNGLNRYDEKTHFYLHSLNLTIPEEPIEYVAGTLPSDCIVELRKNYRFSQESGIGKLSIAIRNGETDKAISLLSEGSDDLLWIQNPYSDSRVENILTDGFHSFFTTESLDDKMNKLDEFRVISPFRKGPSGTENLNNYISSLLTKRGWISPEPGQSHYYEGRIILVQKNDSSLNLSNGDTGFFHYSGDRLHAYFSNTELENIKLKSGDSLRSFPPERIPEHTDCYAMTVHKSQGSEFNTVVLVLPEDPSPILTRELIYTAVTRSRKKFILLGGANILKGSLNTEIHRESGLLHSLSGI